MSNPQKPKKKKKKKMKPRSNRQGNPSHFLLAIFPNHPTIFFFSRPQKSRPSSRHAYNPCFFGLSKMPQTKKPQSIFPIATGIRIHFPSSASKRVCRSNSPGVRIGFFKVTFFPHEIILSNSGCSLRNLIS